MRTGIEKEKLIDDFFYSRIPSGTIEEAIRILTEKAGDVDIDELMKKHWKEKSTRNISLFETFMSGCSGYQYRENGSFTG